jgi:RNA polymerase sigma-70 factor (ECF subfamily)
MDFETVYQELFTPLYRYVFFRVRNYDESMDIIQTVFVKVFEKYSDKEISEITRLSYQIARHEIIDRGRKKQSSPMDPASDTMKNIEDVNIKNPKDYVEHQERVAEVEKLLDELDEDSREVMVLKYLQEKEYSEIAKILGKKESAIRQIVSRSIKKLRTTYE